MEKTKYYAVKVSRRPGIYNTWCECEEQVKGFQEQSLNLFSTLEEAECFIMDDESENVTSDPRTKKEIELSPNSFNIMVEKR